jgi:hypothetical protein
MDKKITKVLFVCLIAGVMTLSAACTNQAKEVAETVPPVETTGNSGTLDSVTLSGSGIAAPEVDTSSDVTDNSPPVSVIKKPEEIKTLADLKELNDWDILYPYVEKMVNNRPISEYNERFTEMTFEGTWEGGLFYRDAANEVIYGFPDTDYTGDQPKKLNGNEVCATMYLSLIRLFPDTKGPKSPDEIRALLGIAMEYRTEEYEISNSGNGLGTYLPQIEISLYIPADEGGLVPESNYSITLRH